MTLGPSFPMRLLSTNIVSNLVFDVSHLVLNCPINLLVDEHIKIVAILL